MHDQLLVPSARGLCAHRWHHHHQLRAEETLGERVCV